jgi:pyrimidine deaminase RibD-like protein
MSKHLEAAIELAKTSKCHYRHGAVVVYKGRVISKATNRRVGDPEVAWRKSHIHAEFAALVAAGSRATGAQVYVARILADGTPANSEPCKKCARLLNRLGVAQVVWTT